MGKSGGLWTCFLCEEDALEIRGEEDLYLLYIILTRDQNRRGGHTVPVVVLPHRVVVVEHRVDVS